MQGTQLNALIPVLQVAIGPVILISGVGLLLLTLTNRFGRAVDRSRQLSREMRGASEAEKKWLSGQVEILYRRAELIRLAIRLGAYSVLFAATLVIALFVTALFHLEAGVFIGLLFICGMASLIGCLITFLRDIQLSLTALKLELRHQPGQEDLT
jgi:hypothetical protein